MNSGSIATLADHQRAMRRTYRGGLHGSLVSAVLWAASAAVATWGSPRQAMVALVVGGFFIFPVTLLVLKLAGRDTRANAANPLNALAMQVAFTVPLALPIVLALAQFVPRLFYPAMMMVVGAHYLPFVTLYGMRIFYVLAAVLLAGGFALGWLAPLGFAVGGWVTAALFVVFAIVSRSLVAAEENREGA